MKTDLELPLPAAREAEKLILGSVLMDYISPSEPSLIPDDFSLEKHRRIFAAATDVHSRGEAVNRLTVAEELRRRDQLEAVDGIGYLVDLEGDALRTNLDSYIRLMHDTAILRRTIAACEDLEQECLHAHHAPASLLERAQRVLQGLSDDARPSGGLKSLGEFVEGYPGGLNRLLEPVRDAEQVTTPWPSVNRMITSFRPTQLVVVAGRPSMGKTSFAGQVAVNAACAGRGVAFFSLEMSTEEILRRLACTRASVDSHKLERGELGAEERRRLYAAAADLTKLPLNVDDSTGCSVAAIHARLRRLGAKHSIQLVVVDYLHLMQSPGRRDNRVQELSAITRGLKLIAREFRVPVLALGQLNRLPETEHRRPTLSDLRDSGSIEQDADIVILLHQPEAKAGASQIDEEVIVKKQRNGPVGTITLWFKPFFTRFEERAR